ncbi:hypothetical protein KAF25_000318 [Fusarium avenaceum]|uniref:Uncharacterized protein n=1 Tax=Fusarium avenaceum TaxID=40199 RepID=A0A9P7KU57_9HYPO|nr:hypothetical protein KAF25_000318 [Fusarium avenaceum]
MDHQLLQIELDRAARWLKEDESFTTMPMERRMYLQTLAQLQVELQTELGRQTQNAIGRSIKNALTSDRHSKKLRDLQNLNNAMDSLGLSTLVARLKDSEAALNRLEGKVDKIIQKMSHDSRFEHEGYRSDSHTSDGSWQESDNDNIVQKVSALSIKGLDILADFLECQDYLELSNRLRVWGLGVVDGPFAIDIAEATWDRWHDLDSNINYYSYPLQQTLDIITVPFIRILYNIQYIITRLEPNGNEPLLFLKESEQILQWVALLNFGMIPPMSHIPSASDSSDIAREIYLCTASIHIEIETLFERLPGLRSIREIFLRAGGRGRRSARRPGGLKRSLAEETVAAAQALTDLLHEKAKQGPKKEKNLIEHISLLFKEETQRLAEWTKSQPATTDEITAELSELRDSLSKQVKEFDSKEHDRPGNGLSSTLNDFQSRLDLLLTLSKVPDKRKGKGRMSPVSKDQNIATISL